MYIFTLCLQIQHKKTGEKVQKRVNKDWHSPPVKQRINVKKKNKQKNKQKTYFIFLTCVWCTFPNKNSKPSCPAVELVLLWFGTRKWTVRCGMLIVISYNIHSISFQLCERPWNDHLKHLLINIFYSHLQPVCGFKWQW